MTHCHRNSYSTHPQYLPFSVITTAASPVFTPCWGRGPLRHALLMRSFLAPATLVAPVSVSASATTATTTTTPTCPVITTYWGGAGSIPVAAAAWRGNVIVVCPGEVPGTTWRAVPVAAAAWGGYVIIVRPGEITGFVWAFLSAARLWTNMQEYRRSG